MLVSDERTVVAYSTEVKDLCGGEGFWYHSNPDDRSLGVLEVYGWEVAVDLGSEILDEPHLRTCVISEGAVRYCVLKASIDIDRGGEIIASRRI